MAHRWLPIGVGYFVEACRTSRKLGKSAHWNPKDFKCRNRTSENSYLRRGRISRELSVSCIGSSGHVLKSCKCSRYFCPRFTSMFKKIFCPNFTSRVLGDTWWYLVILVREDHGHRSHEVGSWRISMGWQEFWGALSVEAKRIARLAESISYRKTWLQTWDILPRDPITEPENGFMEPNNYALRRWLDTPIIVWEHDWMPRVYFRGKGFATRGGHPQKTSTSRWTPLAWGSVWLDHGKHTNQQTPVNPQFQYSPGCLGIGYLSIPRWQRVV